MYEWGSCQNITVVHRKSSDSVTNFLSGKYYVEYNFYSFAHLWYVAKTDTQGMPYQFGNYSEIGLLSYKSPMFKLVFNEYLSLAFTKVAYSTPLNGCRNDKYSMYCLD